ncbi:MAG: DUF6544 family protein [Bacteroidales bacterium]
MNWLYTLAKEEIETLPQAVQNYIEYTGVIGKEKVKRADIRQTGNFKVNGKWTRFKAKQSFDFLNKSFVWKAGIGSVKVTDQYQDNKGLLKVKLFGLIPLMKIVGEEVDQGEVLRLLSEMIWFPSALLSDYIEWEEIDKNTSRATITYGEKKASADFSFEDDGKLVSVKAKRYMESKGSFTLEDWEVNSFEYKEFDTGLLPYKGNVCWHLKDGLDCYCKIQVTEIEIL